MSSVATTSNLSTCISLLTTSRILAANGSNMNDGIAKRFADAGINEVSQSEPKEYTNARIVASAPHLLLSHIRHTGENHLIFGQRSTSPGRCHIYFRCAFGNSARKHQQALRQNHH